jgi:hypothetical protein
MFISKIFYKIYIKISIVKNIEEFFIILFIFQMKTKIIIEIKLINDSSNQSNYILNYHLYIKSFEPQSNKSINH